MFRFRCPRSRLVSLMAGLALTGVGTPASALERLVLRMPFLETSITINLGEAETVDQLLRSSPDLEDLRAASGDRLSNLLEGIFLAPLPPETRSFLEGSTGQPLLEQVLQSAVALVQLEGVEADTSGRMLTDALIRAERNGQATVLGLLREMPGETATIDISRVAFIASRLIRNTEQGRSLVKAAPVEPFNSSLQARLRGAWSRREIQVSVPHRQEPLRTLVLEPQRNSNGRLAVISHGLWDDPESFEGWGEVLASAGYTVLLPDHPGSDFEQQKAMLSGDRPPPDPEELTRRPRDVSALIDAVASGRILRNQSLNTHAVAAIGHSWGGTTVLQLAGADPTDRKMLSRCSDLEDPEGNMSWVLQCSWLSTIREAGAADPRVRAVVSVSPPLRLLFDPASSRSLSGKVLLISGTADWVVPSGPEAISPMRETKAARHGHRLVLYDRANHFTPRSFRGDPQPAAIGALLLAWLNEQLDVSGSVTFSGGGWGDPEQRLVDVSDRL